MADINELRTRMKSVRDTRKITSAMYLISSARMRRARMDLDAARPHFLASQAVIGKVAAFLPGLSHPYLGADAPRPGRSACVLVTGDKGLAGAYNHNVLKLLEEMDTEPARTVVFTVGEVGFRSAQAMGLNVDRTLHRPSQDPDLELARELSAALVRRYLAGELAEIWLLYTRMTRGAAVPVKRRLLPLYPEDFGLEAPPEGAVSPAFIPSPEAVLDSVVPNYVTGFLFDTLVESFCAELEARMTAMKSATDNADEMLARLSLEANRARQEAITQEITEIASGARAQRGSGEL